jgi:hypothetical protein
VVFVLKEPCKELEARDFCSFGLSTPIDSPSVLEGVEKNYLRKPSGENLYLKVQAGRVRKIV